MKTAIKNFFKRLNPYALLLEEMGVSADKVERAGSLREAYIEACPSLFYRRREDAAWRAIASKYPLRFRLMDAWGRITRGELRDSAVRALAGLGAG